MGWDAMWDMGVGCHVGLGMRCCVFDLGHRVGCHENSGMRNSGIRDAISCETQQGSKFKKIATIPAEYRLSFHYSFKFENIIYLRCNYNVRPLGQNNLSFKEKWGKKYLLCKNVKTTKNYRYKKNHSLINLLK